MAHRSSLEKRSTGKALEKISIPKLKEIAEHHLGEIKSLQGSHHTTVLERADRALARSIEQVNEIVQMVEHFKKAAYVRPKRVMVPASASLQEAVRQILHAMQYTFPMNRITVVKIIPHDLPAVPVSPEHLETILFQILQHAREIIGERVGMVTIEGGVRSTPLPEHTDCRTFHIRVSYSCREQLAANMVHMFDPLYEDEAEEPINRFGLFVARKLVEHHKGSISVRTSSMAVTFQMEFTG